MSLETPSPTNDPSADRVADSMQSEAETSLRFWDAQVLKTQYRSIDGPGMMLADSKLVELRRAAEEAAVGALLQLTTELRVLDVGCGTGRWSLWFSQRVREVVAIDFSGEMIRRCQERQTSTTADNVTFLQRNAWEFEDLGSFDVIFAGGVLQYLSDNDLQRFTANAAAGLAADGTVLTRDSVLTKRVDLAGQYPVHYRQPAEYKAAFAAAGLHLVTDQRAYLYPQFVSKLPAWFPLRGAWLERAVAIDGYISTHAPVRWLWPVYRSLTGRGIGAVPDHRFFLYRRGE